MACASFEGRRDKREKKKEIISNKPSPKTSHTPPNMKGDTTMLPTLS